MMDLPDSDFSILHHSLGITNPGAESYRNHFVASDGHHSIDAIKRLCAAGLMKEGRAPSFIGDGQKVFYVTDAGKKKALETQPKPPKMTRSQRRYKLYLKSESDQKFGEWLKDPYWDDYRKDSMA